MPFACLFQQVAPSCPAVPGGCFPGASPAPILHTWLKGKGTGDIKPRETTAPGPPLPPVLHQEEGGLPATADWALLHPVSSPLVPYTCFSSLEEPQKEEGPNFLLLTGTCPSQYGTRQVMGYQVARQVLSHHQHPPKPR